jgi:hypothetical protein
MSTNHGGLDQQLGDRTCRSVGAWFDSHAGRAVGRLALMANDPEVTATGAMGIVARAPGNGSQGKLALRLTRFLFARDGHRRLARRRP